MKKTHNIYMITHTSDIVWITIHTLYNYTSKFTSNTYISAVRILNAGFTPLEI